MKRLSWFIFHPKITLLFVMIKPLERLKFEKSKDDLGVCSLFEAKHMEKMT
jgi:hypothetical protein